MSTRVVAGLKPIVLDLLPGTYHYCACGRSRKQPFCDGSHAGTGLEPLPFTVAEKRKCALCTCKHSAQSPLCDGSHKALRTP